MTLKEKWKRSDLKNVLKRTGSPFGLISMLVLVVYAFSLLFPLFWAIVTSLRNPIQFTMDRLMGSAMWPYDWSNPKSWANNYEIVFQNFGIALYIDGIKVRIGFMEQLGNSLMYALGSSICGTLTCLLVAYAVAMFDFKASGVIYTVIIIQMILPIVGAEPSSVRMAVNLGLYDTMWGMWIMKTFVSGLYFLVFHSSFQLIPKDYAEAAQLDGAGCFRVMVNIMFPFVKGSIFTIFLLKFIGLWNDYQTPLLYMPTHPTIAYGVYAYTRNSVSQNKPTQLAATMLLAVPLFVVFIVFQKRLLGDLTIGGLK